MTIFATTDELYSLFTPFMRSLTTDPVVGPKLAAANTAFRVNHTDPDGVFLLDASVSPPVLHVGEEARSLDADVELTMTSDDGHLFWLGQLNLPIALAKRKVKVDGGVTKLMGLIPALQPAYGLYRQHLADAGREAS